MLALQGFRKKIGRYAAPYTGASSVTGDGNGSGAMEARDSDGKQVEGETTPFERAVRRFEQQDRLLRRLEVDMGHMLVQIQSSSTGANYLIATKRIEREAAERMEQSIRFTVLDPLRVRLDRHDKLREQIQAHAKLSAACDALRSVAEQLRVSRPEEDDKRVQSELRLNQLLMTLSETEEKLLPLIVAANALDLFNTMRLQVSIFFCHASQSLLAGLSSPEMEIVSEASQPVKATASATQPPSSSVSSSTTESKLSKIPSLTSDGWTEVDGSTSSTSPDIDAIEGSEEEDEFRVSSITLEDFEMGKSPPALLGPLNNVEVIAESTLKDTSDLLALASHPVGPLGVAIEEDTAEIRGGDQLTSIAPPLTSLSATNNSSDEAVEVILSEMIDSVVQHAGEDPSLSSNACEPDTSAAPVSVAMKRSLLEAKIRRVLRAYVVYNPRVGYCQGMGFLVRLLTEVAEAEADIFWLFVGFSEPENDRNLYEPGMAVLQPFLSKFELLFSTHMPELYAHFQAEGVYVATFCTRWFLTFFSSFETLGPALVIRLLDIFVIDGWRIVFSMALVVLDELRDQLLRCDLEGILRVLQFPRNYMPEPDDQRQAQLIRHALAGAAAGAPATLSSWVPGVSKFWSAKDDDRCPAPRSDDYKDWTLMQLKREITERQLKTNPKKRNKDAFVRVLLMDDEVEAADDAQQQIQHAQQVERQITAASNQEVVNICDDEEEDVEDVDIVAVQAQSASLSSQRAAASRPSKKRKKSITAATNTTETSETSLSTTAKGSMEYLRHKLSIQAARVDIESRRLELETKREQRSNELHAVQIALAQEQLQQAKLATQKMKTEWLVDQLLQKKRLRDAGISTEESAGLGLF
ncbi:hypothetical protein BBJ28_00005220 [Nothophytophthora sp. Chile5]|nr:hypothetical protein BBJ28_00005220 [Nothophytophthora sp. Chile5]